MKYKYTPNCKIIDYEKMKVKFQFDANGEFETEDPKLIVWIKKNKNFLRPFQKPEKPKTETKPEKEPAREPAEDKKVYKCKKCDFETDNVGSLMAHYRTEHKKGNKGGD